MKGRDLEIIKPYREDPIQVSVVWRSLWNCPESLYLLDMLPRRVHAWSTKIRPLIYFCAKKGDPNENQKNSLEEIKYTCLNFFCNKHVSFISIKNFSRRKEGKEGSVHDLIFLQLILIGGCGWQDKGAQTSAFNQKAWKSILITEPKPLISESCSHRG